MSDVDVPADYLQFLLKQSDLWPETRGQIEAELRRRTTATASATRGEKAEPLDARLRGDEERVVPIRCPRCGHDVDCFVRLVRKVSNRMLAAAMGYLEHGLAVVPMSTPTATGCSCHKGPACTSPGKHPRVEWKPLQERRATEAEIREWWTRWPDANVGLVTGMVSRLVVLDVDPRNGGFDTLADFDAVGARMPDDNAVDETGSRGLHHYFRLEAPLAKAAPFAGIEVQADGGLVVAPPSLHHTGRRYRWLRGLDSPWTPVPAWVRWACTPPELAPVAMIPLGDAERDDVLGELATRGLYLARHRRQGLHRIHCPWAPAHSNGDSEAVVTEPGASPAPGWGFNCLHAHCVDRTIGDLLTVLGMPRRAA